MAEERKDGEKSQYSRIAPSWITVIKPFFLNGFPEAEREKGEGGGGRERRWM